ncbi:MAG: universal stress protein [Akkermansiaceae bacterium]
MKRFKHLLVVLPEGTPETTLLKWAAVMGRASEASSIDLLCCEEALLEEFPATLEDSSPSYADHVESSAKEILGNLNYTIIHRQGGALRETLGCLSSGVYDILLTSLHDGSSRGLAERLARKSPTGVLAIPPDAVTPPTTVATAIDFSDMSSLCIQWAEAFATLNIDVAGEPARKEALHATDITVPTRATLTMSESDLQAWVREGTDRQMSELLSEHALDKDSWHSEIIESQLPGVDLTTRVKRDPGTLLILGCHGRNAFSIALLGSQACEAIRSSKSPILVAKRKNDNLRFLRDLIGAN